MFSGRWEDRLERDSEGRVFLDYNPYCFGKILDYLWAMQVGDKQTEIIGLGRMRWLVCVDGVVIKRRMSGASS